jgi:hypothetical protein
MKKSMFSFIKSYGILLFLQRIIVRVTAQRRKNSSKPGMDGV